MKEVVKELVKLLLKVNAIKFGDFTLTSGARSPYYIDLRVMISYPDVFDKVTDMYVEMIKKNVGDFDYVAGVATAGIPIATLVAYKLRKPMVYVRKERKGHGTGRMVEGAIVEGAEAVVVDDVLTTGSSIARAVDVLRSEGLVVRKAVVLIDREQCGASKLKSIGVQVYSVAKVSELFRVLYEYGLINEEKYVEVMRYVEASRRGCGTTA